MSRIRHPLFLWLLWLPATTYSAEPPALFSNDAAAVIRVELTAPLQAIARDSDADPASYPATLLLTATGERFDVQLKPRGKSRRKRSNCRFPPLWIAMAKTAVQNTRFAGHHRRKLVTHCTALERSGKDASKVWLEMLAYRALNLLTERSFRVQPLAIVYRDSDDPQQAYAHSGFLIEHKKELARRLGLAGTDNERLRLSTLDPTHANLNALFNLMIGNPDFSLTQGPAGERCCHNSVPLLNAEGIAYPIMYDFDNTGLVNPRYASPPAVLDLRSVRQRVYRGYCRHNALIAANVEALLAKRPAIEALFSGHPGISPSEKRRVRNYLNQFFDRYTTEAAQSRRLRGACLG